MATDQAAGVRFRETQRFNPWFFLPLGGLLAVLALVSASFGGYVWLTQMLIAALLAGMWLLLRIDTEVGDDGALRVRLFPFMWRTIRPEEVVSAEVRTYRPILEYGGWGLRWGWSSGRAYNARGNRGVQLVLSGERRVLIGSQRPEELLAALRTVGGG